MLLLLCKMDVHNKSASGRIVQILSVKAAADFQMAMGIAYSHYKHYVQAELEYSISLRLLALVTAMNSSRNLMLHFSNC